MKFSKMITSREKVYDSYFGIDPLAPKSFKSFVDHVHETLDYDISDQWVLVILKKCFQIFEEKGDKSTPPEPDEGVHVLLDWAMEFEARRYCDEVLLNTQNKSIPTTLIALLRQAQRKAILDIYNLAYKFAEMGE